MESLRASLAKAREEVERWGQKYEGERLCRLACDDRALAAERARDEAVAALRRNGPALQYADEVIHGEFCGSTGCHGVCNEFRALADRVATGWTK